MDNIKLLIKACTGYAIEDSDMPLLGYIYNEVSQYIKNECNISEIPEGLMPTLEEMTAGKFLMLQKAKVLGSDNFDVVKSIREGDTTVEFGGTSPEQRYDSLVKNLLKGRDLSCYRKLRW